MTIFLLICAALLAAVLLRLGMSMLRVQKPADEDTRQHNIAIARERLEELRKEHEKGELSDEEFAQAREDLEIALAQDLSTADAKVEQKRNPRTAGLTMILLLILVPLIVAGVYLRTGSPKDLGVEGPGKPVAMPSTGKRPPIQDLAKELERRLNEKPDNPQGWYLLGTTYMKINNFDGAVRAFQRLHKLLPKDPTVLISLADAMTMQHQGKVPEAAMPLLQQALKLQPDSVSALWLAGIGAAEHGDPKQAIEHWQRAYPLISEQPEMQQQLRNMIEKTAQQAGIKVELPAAQPAATATPAPTSPQPQPNNASSAAATAPAKQGASVRVAVALAPALLDKVSPNTTVFVYAKAASGPPMPLAVARMTVGDLPAKVILDDNMSMMPQMKLSNFPEVLVGARVSLSGQAMPQSGDYESREVKTSVDNAKQIELIINKPVP